MSNRGALLTPEQVSRRVGLAIATLAKMRVRGEGPAWVKVGAAVRYPQEEVTKWVDGLPVRFSTSSPAA